MLAVVILLSWWLPWRTWGEMRCDTLKTAYTLVYMYVRIYVASVKEHQTCQYSLKCVQKVMNLDNY